MDNIDEKQAQEKPTIDPEIEAKLQAAELLAEENRRLRTESLLRKHGANEDAMEDLLQIYKSPEIPENTSDEDAQKLLQEHINSFREKRSWGFAQVSESATPEKKSTHNTKITPPPSGYEAAYEEAKKNRNVSEMLRLKPFVQKQ